MLGFSVDTNKRRRGGGRAARAGLCDPATGPEKNFENVRLTLWIVFRLYVMGVQVRLIDLQNQSTR